MSFSIDELKTPHKHGSLVIKPTYRKGDFNSHAVDCPFVGSVDGSYYMSYVGWDGIGYRTGLASSIDLENWTDLGMIIDRGPAGSVTEFNIAMTGMLRDNTLYGPGKLKKIDGNYIGTYHAYPNAGYEAGPAVIGICRSKDLRSWTLDKPCLFAKDGAEWERGGLYKSWIMQVDDTFYLFYNAKNKPTGWIEQTGFATSKDLINWQRYPHNPILPVGGEGAFDEIFASDPAVYRHQDKWVMYYFGVKKGWTARDSVAISEDLIHWQKTNEILIDVGEKGSFDYPFAHKPSMCYHNGKLYHFYCATQTFKKQLIGEITHNEYRGITFAKS